MGDSIRDKLALPQTVKEDKLERIQPKLTKCPVTSCNRLGKALGRHYRKAHPTHWKKAMEIQRQVFEMAHLLGWRPADVDRAIGTKVGVLSARNSQNLPIVDPHVQSELLVLRDLMAEEIEKKHIPKPKYHREPKELIMVRHLRAKQRYVLILLGFMFGMVLGLSATLVAMWVRA